MFYFLRSTLSFSDSTTILPLVIKNFNLFGFPNLSKIGFGTRTITLSLPTGNGFGTRTITLSLPTGNGFGTRTITLSLPTGNGFVCECTDHQYHKSDCKHIHVILDIIKQNRGYANNEFKIMKRSKFNLCKYCRLYNGLPTNDQFEEDPYPRLAPDKFTEPYFVC